MVELAPGTKVTVRSPNIKVGVAAPPITTNLRMVGSPGPQGPTGPQGDPGVVQSIVAGANVTVDSTDPTNPVVSATDTTDHGALSGLGDDDHPQYALADGSRGSFAATGHTHDDRYYTESEVAALLADAGFEIGDTKTTARENIGANWLDASGQELSRTTYSEVFDALGGTASPYGLPTSDTFKLPDFNNRTVRGGERGLGGGADSVTIEAANLPPHAHSLPDHSHTFDLQYADTTTTGGTAYRVTDIENATAGGGTSAKVTTDSSGGGGNTGNGPGTSSALNVANPWTGARVIIKVK